ncbi:MAG: methyltransferase domain-containing protein [Cellvibrionaceae bacterium]
MQEFVQEYYGQQLQSSEDLKTSACCDISAIPEWLKPLLANIHPEVLSRYYGCGLVCPSLLEGCRILDLGSGSGRDVYALSQLVGAKGQVIGVDMTDEQLDIAEQFKKYHSQKFGFNNVEFKKGFLENLDDLDLEEGSFDVIVSNCVINLCTDKDAVLKSIFKLLKPGGEFYFSDVYSDKRVPIDVKNDEVLYGECLGGALYWNDFINLSKNHGFIDPRLVEDRPLEITDPSLTKRTGTLQFFSATYRLFKIENLENECEDYGQAVIYKGTIPEHPDYFQLDKHHFIETNRVFPVCGNTWRMLNDTRFKTHFDFIGSFDKHFGIFEGCGTLIPFSIDELSHEACC